jgi:hypothetical protein
MEDLACVGEPRLDPSVIFYGNILLERWGQGPWKGNNKNGEKNEKEMRAGFNQTKRKPMCERKSQMHMLTSAKLRRWQLLGRVDMEGQIDEIGTGSKLVIQEEG